MKRLSKLLAITVLFLIILTGCTEDKTIQKRKTPQSEDFLIIWNGSSLEKQTAYLIESELCRMGYTAVTQNEKTENNKAHDCIIAVGENAELSSKYDNITSVWCVPEGGIISREADIYPYISTKDIVRAAILLLPSAEEFALISEEGATTDIQDACDYLDLGGLDYTVEITGSRSLGDTVISSEEKGCDAVIMPTHSLEGINLAPLGCKSAMIAVGEGEAVRGALASFCIDVELLARHTAALAVSKVKKEDWTYNAESYYVVCVSKKLSKDHTVDLGALREDFKVVSVE